MEVFLYEWWPIRGEATLADRLSRLAGYLASGSYRLKRTHGNS